MTEQQSIEQFEPLAIFEAGEQEAMRVRAGYRDGANGTLEEAFHEIHEQLQHLYSINYGRLNFDQKLWAQSSLYHLLSITSSLRKS